MMNKAPYALALSGTFLAGGIYQYTRHVQSLSSPPPQTLLEEMNNRGLTTDCFEIRVADNMGSMNVTNDQFVRAFLRSRVFSLERFILSRAGGEFAKHVYTNEEIEGFKLEVGDQVSSIFKVVDKRDERNELALCWDEGHQGHTWLQVQPGVLRFGSAFDPNSDFQQSVPAPLFAVLNFYHRYYSRVLLVAARNQLSRDLRRNREID